MSTPNLITLSLAGGEKEDQLLLKDLDMEVRYNDLDFEFQVDTTTLERGLKGL